jgi:transposase
MANRRKDSMEIQEILRRLRAGESDRAIHRALGMHRETVKKYRVWASEQGLLTGELPSVAELHQLLAATLPSSAPPQNVSSVEPYRELVVRLRAEGVEVAAIHARLQERGYGGSYAAVWRFVRQLEPTTPEATVRVERRPGEEAQVDFGYAGRMRDPVSGQMRRSWAFVMTLSWSRHQYVEFVLDQRVETWLMCHRRAFAFFGGVPQRIVLDNLKAAIVRACQDEPQVQQAYRECAAHYGFLIAPCRVRTPQHKGKVEQGGVHYVKRNFLGGRAATTLKQANRDVRHWCQTTAGQREHGTTKRQPLVCFQENEQACLQPLPTQPYDIGIWKLLKLHRDCHVVFEGSYYSAPFAYIGQRLRLRAGLQWVRLYSPDYQLIASHERAEAPGTRRTHLEHLPPAKVPGLVLNRTGCQAQAAVIGPATAAVVQHLLDDPVIDRLPTAGRLLRLGEPYGEARLEAACQRALAFGDPAYLTVKRILTQQLDQQPRPSQTPPPSPARTFVRNARELVGHVLGGVSWS